MMTMTRTACRRPWRVALALALVLFPATRTAAQGPPVDADPTTFAFRLGPLLLTPGLRINELGVDTNVFQDDVNPKRDYVVAVSPDLTVFLRMRFLRFTMFTAAEFRHYVKYESERSVGQQLRARLDFLLSRLKPYVSAARVNSFDRPTKEIDARAEHLMPEYAGGVYFELSPQSNLYVDVTRSAIEYRNGEQFQGVALDRSLNHVTYRYSGGLTSAVTPLTSFTVSGNYEDSQFDWEPLRDTTSRGGTVQLRFGPEAVMRGELTVGYRDFRPVDPEVVPYQGVIASGRLGLPVLDRGSLNFTGSRDVQYSFDAQESYYLDSQVTVAYNHRVVGPFDLQVSGGYGEMNYGNRLGRLPKAERVETYAGGVGYNLKDQSRLGFDYEYQKRHSDQQETRGYVRRRVFGSWSYRF